MFVVHGLVEVFGWIGSHLGFVWAETSLYKRTWIQSVYCCIHWGTVRWVHGSLLFLHFCREHTSIALGWDSPRYFLLKIVLIGILGRLFPAWSASIADVSAGVLASGVICVGPFWTHYLLNTARSDPVCVAKHLGRRLKKVVHWIICESVVDVLTPVRCRVRILHIVVLVNHVWACCSVLRLDCRLISQITIAVVATDAYFELA